MIVFGLFRPDERQHRVNLKGTSRKETGRLFQSTDTLFGDSICRCHKAGSDLLGYVKEYIVAGPFKEFLHPDDRDHLFPHPLY